jgi:hypothetical protein
MFSLDCPLIPRALDWPLALPLRIALPERPDPVAEPLSDPVADPLFSWLEPADDALLPFWLAGLSELSCPAGPVEPLEPFVCDHTRLPLSAIVPLKTIPDKINSFRCIRSSPFYDLWRCVPIVRCNGYATSSKTLAFSTAASNRRNTIASSVPSANKAGGECLPQMGRKSLRI